MPSRVAALRAWLRALRTRPESLRARGTCDWDDAGGAPEPLAVLLLARAVWFVLCYHAVRDMWNRTSKAHALARLMLRLPAVVHLRALTLLVSASVAVVSARGGSNGPASSGGASEAISPT